MSNRHAALADLVLELEAEMRRIGLWEETPPEPARLASTLPFHHDTLEFPQWLQWVFLPRLRALVESGAPLPTSSDIHPLAEYRFTGLPQETGALLALIKRVDELLNAGG